MIGYTLKHVLELVPEALPLVKSASIEEEFPVSSKDNCLASALAIEYTKHFTSNSVDYDAIEKVAGAVSLFGLEDSVKALTDKMLSRSDKTLTKKASLLSGGSYLTKQAFWEGTLSGLTDVKEVAQQAEILFEKAASESLGVSDLVERYSGNGYLVKESVLASLGRRYSATSDGTFVKIASAVGNESELISSERTVKSLCSAINRLDEKYGLGPQGFDFYKESMITKEAGFAKSMVKVAGNDYPLNRILGIPSTYLDSYMGAGFAKELNNDPNSAKYMVESLPADSQQILASILKNS